MWFGCVALVVLSGIEAGHLPARWTSTRCTTAFASACGDENYRGMVIFRAPSRHTYGFIEDYSKYDLPIIELRSLLSSVSAGKGIRFIPVVGDSSMGAKRQPPPKSRKQSKKKVSKHPHDVQLLYWIECVGCNGNIHHGDISKATPCSILTHATFAIKQSVAVSDKDWWDVALDYDNVGNHNLYKIIGEMDIIDMTNPNMSRIARSELIERVSRLIEKHNPEIQQQLQLLQSDANELDSILLYNCITPTEQEQCKDQSICHFLYFGYRTAIGAAGTKGAPSQTLRRTNRGLLKEYALKNRIVASVGDAYVRERGIISTAMEPEIGFLLANLAGIRKGAIVLDPCCGSGSLLLYAAALGAKQLVGIDSDPNVWKDADAEFKRHVCILDGKPLATPQFFHGDVSTASPAEALGIQNSYDAIVCDPPYNIGAPIIADGKDQRPRNHHCTKNNDDSYENKSASPSTTDLVYHILVIARKVLVRGGRIVFFFPVRGEEITMTIESLLLSRGCNQMEVDRENQELPEGADCLRLLRGETRLQRFSPTFSRYLVCMEKA